MVPAPSQERPRLREPRTILDMVNYRLYLIGGMNSSLVTKICEGEYGITRREWRAMALLAAMGPMSPSELAQLAMLDRSRTSKALMELLKKGLIEKRRLSADRRWVVVGLTDRGRELYGRLFPHVRAINKALLKALTDAECEQLSSILSKLQQRATALSVSDEEHPAVADRRRGGSQRAWQTNEAGGSR